MAGAAPDPSHGLAAEVSNKLEAIERIGAVSDGRVCLLDFSVIHDKLGSRWEAKKQDVYDLISRFIQRVSGPSAIHAVVRDCQFVVCYAERDRRDAAAISFRIVEEVLTHLLGTIDPTHVKVGQVTSVTNGKVVSEPVSLRKGLVPQSHSTTPLKPKPKVTPEPVLVEGGGGRVPIRFRLESIIGVRASNAVGYRLSATLMDEHGIRPLALRERAALPTASLLAIDLRSLLEARASGLLSGRYRFTMLPLCIQSFSYSRSRTAIFDVLNRLKVEERSRLLVELVGLEEGAPLSAIAESAALLRPFCRTVVFQTPVGRSGIANLRSARPHALSVAAGDLGSQHAKLAAGLLVMGETAKGVAPLLFATGLTSEALLGVCEVAGFTHATLIV